MKESSIQTKTLVFSALMAAVMCIVGPLSIPIGPVHMSLATFAVYLGAYLFGWKISAYGVACYLLIGAAGLPVFSGSMGGLSRLVGPTGGYLAGYLAIALLTGWGREYFRILGGAAGMVLGTAVCYAIGTAWFIVQMKCPLSYAMGVCVYPFLILDACKMVAAVGLGAVVRSRIGERLLQV